MLKIDLEPGDSVRIGDSTVVTVLEKSGRRTRLSFQADASVPIRRVKSRSSDSKIAAANGIAGALSPA